MVWHVAHSEPWVNEGLGWEALRNEEARASRPCRLAHTAFLASSPSTPLSLCSSHIGLLRVPKAYQARACLRAFAQALVPGILADNHRAPTFTSFMLLLKSPLPKDIWSNDQIQCVPHVPKHSSHPGPYFSGAHHLEYYIIYSLTAFPVDSLSLSLECKPNKIHPINHACPTLDLQHIFVE